MFCGTSLVLVKNKPGYNIRIFKTKGNIFSKGIIWMFNYKPQTTNLFVIIKNFTANLGEASKRKEKT